MQNLWVALAHNEDRLASRLPKTNKGRMVEDIFQTLNLEVFNPDDITLENYRLMVEGDSAISSSVQVIINSVISRGWEIIGGDDEIRDFLIPMYERLQMNIAFQRILTAFWVGFSATEKVFDQFDDGRWFIRQYKTLPPDTITFVMQPNGQIRRIIQDGFFIGFTDRRVSFSPAKMTVMTYDGGLSTNFGNPYGLSALKPAYKDWFSKDWLMRYKNKFLEFMAGGALVAHVGNGNVDAMNDQIINLSSGGTAVTRGTGDNKQSIEFLSPPGDGQVWLNNLDYHDSKMRQALVVPPGLVGQESRVSSGVMGAKQFDVFQRTRVEQLQQQLENLMAHDIRQIVDINFGKQEMYPRFSFKVAGEEDLRNRSRFILDLVKAGVLNVNHLSWIYRKLEIPQEPMGAPIGPIKPIDISDTPANPGNSGTRERPSESEMESLFDGLEALLVDGGLNQEEFDMTIEIIERLKE